MTIVAADLVFLLCNLKMWYLNVVFTEIKVSSFSLSLETAHLPYWALLVKFLCVLLSQCKGKWELQPQYLFKNAARSSFNSVSVRI